MDAIRSKFRDELVHHSLSVVTSVNFSVFTMGCTVVSWLCLSRGFSQWDLGKFVEAYKEIPLIKVSFLVGRDI